VVEDLHRRLGVRHREDGTHRVPLGERHRPGTILFHRLFEREEAVRRKAGDGSGIEQAHRLTRALDQRVLRVVERKRLAGAAADVIVRAQNPTLTTVSPACAENAVPRRIAAVNVVFIARLSATPPTPLSGTDPRTARAAGWPPARR